MGDNYYLHEGICKCCKASKKQTHIGKSSGGWTFSFRGYRSEWDDPKIESYKMWLVLIEAATENGDAEIRDEYGDTINVEDFKKMVKAKENAKMNHTTYCEEKHPEHAARDCWLDEEGHSFSGGEFS